VQYLERTLQVKAALLRQPELLNEIRAIFADHMSENGLRRPMGMGNTRTVYDVGTCEVAPSSKIQLLLKLRSDRSELEFKDANRDWEYNEWSEYGVFETYYDFVAGHINTLSFLTRSGFERYRTQPFGRNMKSTFSLNENWGGTQVEQGDVGALPYFQLVIKCGKLYGQLTEGEPPLIEPKGTARYRGTLDDYTVENNRIIDMGPTQAMLIDADGHRPRGHRYPNNLGIRSRGKKYFQRCNRLDV